MEQIFPQLQPKKSEKKESTLTFGIIAVTILMLSFLGAGVYVLVNTFFD